ncbi:hypothetical protein STEG23_000133, partial [Scotinomys teguina]
MDRANLHRIPLQEPDIGMKAEKSEKQSKPATSSYRYEILSLKRDPQSQENKPGWPMALEQDERSPYQLQVLSFHLCHEYERHCFEKTSTNFSESAPENSSDNSKLERFKNSRRENREQESEKQHPGSQERAVSQEREDAFPIMQDNVHPEASRPFLRDRAS